MSDYDVSLLGRILVEQKQLTRDQLAEALREQRHKHRHLGALLEALFDIPPAVIERAWATQYAMLLPTVDLATQPREPRGLSTSSVILGVRCHKPTHPLARPADDLLPSASSSRGIKLHGGGLGAVRTFPARGAGPGGRSGQRPAGGMDDGHSLREHIS